MPRKKPETPPTGVQVPQLPVAISAPGALQELIARAASSAFNGPQPQHELPVRIRLAMEMIERLHRAMAPIGVPCCGIDFPFYERELKPKEAMLLAAACEQVEMFLERRWRE